MAIGIFFDEFHISQDEQKLKEFILIDEVVRYFKEATSTTTGLMNPCSWNMDYGCREPITTTGR